MKLLGVRVDTYDRHDVEDRLRMFVLSKSAHRISTINPELAMWAQHDSEFRALLNTSDLALPDGFGLTLAARRQGTRIHRITGFDLVIELMRIAQEEHATVFLLGGKDWSVHHAALKIKKLFPGVKVVGAEAGPEITHHGGYLQVDNDEHRLIIDHLKLLKPEILLVGFGHPKQEKWIAKALPNLPSVRIAVGVGGVFDYLSGSVMRAPSVMRALGLEWLFRLFRQPWRLARIYTATVRFLIAVSREKRG